MVREGFACVSTVVAALVLLTFSLQPAKAAHDPASYAQFLKDNQASAIAADMLVAKATPLFTGYAAINTKVPVNIQVNCHTGPKPFPGQASSKSASSKKYIDDIAYIAGDGYEPVTAVESKGDYNQSWSLGLAWGGWCQFDAAHHPACNFTFDSVSRASGLTQITRVPDAKIQFVSCGVYMDGTTVNSTTCFQDDSTTVVKVTAAYPEENVSEISFISTYRDLSADGPPGDYGLAFSCQYTFNSAILFNAPGNAAGLDPRLTAVIPDFQNGPFGPAGNGGNTGRRLLRG